MTQIDGKYVLLTGGSRGVGPVIAEHLAGRGAHIALSARSEKELETVAENLRKHDVTVLTVRSDLSERNQRQKLVETVLGNFGRIDILINNAGVETEGAYTDLAWENIAENIEVNLVAPMELIHLLLPGMLERRTGHVVNIASVAAKCGGPYAAVYDATKAGIAELAQGLRLELHKSGVSFSTIFPGFVRDVGMFARFNMKAPLMMGSCTSTQVAKAVVRSIERNIPEIVVNSTPQKSFYAIKELSPSLGDFLLRRTGIVSFQRKKVGL